MGFQYIKFHRGLIMNIEIPVTIQENDSTIHTPFGDKKVPGTSITKTIILHIDEATANLIANTLKI